MRPELASSNCESAFGSSTFSNAGSGNQRFEASASLIKSLQVGRAALKSIPFLVPSFAVKGTTIKAEVTD